MLSPAKSSNPWFGHFLRRDFYLSHASQKVSSIPCENVAIVDLAPTYLDGGKNLDMNFLSTSS